jgi:hypothetical protein
MRLLIVLVGALLLAGCGSAAQQTNVPASSGEDSRVPVPAMDTEADPPELKPPVIVLASKGGKQEAVQGSYCIDYVDPDSGQGQGACSDSAPIHPAAVTVVQPGEEVVFSPRGGEIVRPEGCHADDEQGCIGYVHVKALGCDEPEVESVPLALGPETRWTIDLKAGAYQLDFFGYFKSSSGATGDVSGTLGLLVGGEAKRNDYLGVVGVKPTMQECPFED